ncbi:MAG: glycerol-3-phosphate 1-O-acyltransferase PlsY [Vicinamibacterales bacterium]|jgi:glycerol-3-phosphate acyltransferase PlsY|nr:acyl-phosphate glycerol 3-phosphate acyltransferase [Acidobacteriota bacterium]MDP7294095.1 glycerol-3-phosphate 1-O-acyltransferase PlsY [Vicinamibacterales bacterium]MDP7671386.1 glycerol-3-phosphate 1-O-acyltransferase PlsY [Vicinamibacterales bacterium]
MTMELWWVVLGYLVGSVPFGFLVPRVMAGVDVREVGSRNVGAANAFRSTRTSVGLAVLILDVAKGCAVVFLAGRFGVDDPTRAAAGVAAIVGHVYPVWLGFHGGKGVATAGGVFGVLSPAAAAVAAATFVAVVWRTRYVSVGSIVATTSLVPVLYLMGASSSILIGAALTAALILYRHRGNVARLSAGTERRFGQG